MKQLDLSHQIRPEAFQTRISRLVRKAVHTHLPEITGSVLDVGCGNGLFMLELLSRKGRKNRVFGIDIDPAALQNGKILFRDNNLMSCVFVRGDAFRLPFGDNLFSLVFCTNTLVNLTPFSLVEKLITEMHRVCISGGFIIFDFRNGSNPLVKFRYLRNQKKGGVTTVAHRISDFSRIFHNLGINEIEYIPIGGFWKFPGMGILVKARK